MNGLDLCRYALWSCVVAALLSGCGGLQPPIGAPGTAPQSRTVLRDKDLIYITSVPYIDIFSFTDGKLLRQIKGQYPYGLCVNGAGDVFVVDPVADDITEYGHGAPKPKETLPFPSYSPTQCAADPATGNLAVISGSGADVRSATQTFEVWIYPQGKGTPTEYQFDGMNFLYYAAYDDKSDLFIDGTSASGGFGLVELPNGKSTFRSIRLNEEILNRIRSAGGIQWSAGRLAVGNDTRYPRASIDQLRIGGAQAHFGNQTVLSGSSGIGPFWIQNGSAIVPEEDAAYLWKYPKGGKPFATLAVSGGDGVVVSLARK